MPINNITQTISILPPAGKRGVDVQTVFVIKQEDFQDHLQGITITELNTLKDQLNSRIGEINSTATTINGYADTASAGASTATTKAGEASTSASEALTSRNQAEHWATVAQSASGEDIKGSDIASATTTIIGTAGLGDYIHITGTATIISFGTAANAGVKRTLIFDDALTITNGANLICVGGVNITTVANTIVSVVAETTTQWRVEYVTHPSISFAELGYLDGVTGNIQNQINNKFTAASATESVQGVIELATAAEAQAGTDGARAITPLQLFNSLKGSRQSLTTSGYQKLHGGLIIQWGKATTNYTGTSITFPISFPTAGLISLATRYDGANLTEGADYSGKASTDSLTTTGMNVTGHGGTNLTSWFAIGY